MIVNTLSDINISIGSFAQTTYGNLATDIGSLGVILGTVGLLILTINMMFQLVPAHGGAYVVWGVKFMLILAAASNWAYFKPIYDAITALPGSISALILGGTNIETALQAAVDELWAAYDTLWSAGGIRNIGLNLAAILIAVVAVFLTVAAILVIGISSMGLALSLGLAPLFIICLMFKSTQDLFSSWTKFTLSFVLTLILTATVISFLLASVNSAVSSALLGTTLRDFAPLLVQAVAVIFFMMMVPHYAMALAGTLATGGITLATAGLTSLNIIKSSIETGIDKADGARTYVARGQSMLSAGAAAKRDGGSLREQAQAMRQRNFDDQQKSYTASDRKRQRYASKDSIKTDRDNNPQNKP